MVQEKERLLINDSVGVRELQGKVFHVCLLVTAVVTAEAHKIWQESAKKKLHHFLTFFVVVTYAGYDTRYFHAGNKTKKQCQSSPPNSYGNLLEST